MCGPVLPCENGDTRCMLHMREYVKQLQGSTRSSSELHQPPVITHLGANIIQVAWSVQVFHVTHGQMQLIVWCEILEVVIIWQGILMSTS